MIWGCLRESEAHTVCNEIPCLGILPLRLGRKSFWAMFSELIWRGKGYFEAFSGYAWLCFSVSISPWCIYIVLCFVEVGYTIVHVSFLCLGCPWYGTWYMLALESSRYPVLGHLVVYIGFLSKDGRISPSNFAPNWWLAKLASTLSPQYIYIRLHSWFYNHNET